MISVEEARARILDAVERLAPVMRHVAQALGQVLAEDDVFPEQTRLFESAPDRQSDVIDFVRLADVIASSA